MGIAALVLFLIGAVLNAITVLFSVNIPHLSTWSWVLLFVGLIFWLLSGGPSIPNWRGRNRTG